MHLITLSLVTAVLIFHEKYEKMLIITKVDLDLNKNLEERSSGKEPVADTLHRYSPTLNRML